MDSNIDFKQFKSQHDLHNALRALTTTLRESTNAANVANFPTVDGQPLPFDNLLRALKIDVNQPEAPVFTFNCTGVTLAQVEAECIANNHNFMTFTQSRGNKLYYNRTYDAVDQRWVEMSRPEAADSTQEQSELIFLDSRNTVVDWRSSLNNLKRLSNDRRYTTQMMHTALLKIINKYLPEQTLLLKQKTADEIAQFLLKLDSKVDKLSFYKQQLYQSQRNVSEDIESAIAHLTNIVDKIYPETVAANAVHRENILKTAVISFVPDSISFPLLAEIKRESAKCSPMQYSEIVELAMSAEQHYQISIKAPLLFGRDINSAPAATQMQFNSIIQAAPKKKKKLGSFTEGYPDYRSTVPGQTDYAYEAPAQQQQQQQQAQVGFLPVNQAVNTPEPQLLRDIAAEARTMPVILPIQPINLFPRRNFSNLTNPLEELNIESSEVDSDGEGLKEERTIVDPNVTQYISGDIRQLPALDFNALSPETGVTKTESGWTCVQNNQAYRLINVPETGQSKLTHPTDSAGLDFSKAATSTPVHQKKLALDPRVQQSDSAKAEEIKQMLTRQQAKKAKDVSLNAVLVRDFYPKKELGDRKEYSARPRSTSNNRNSGYPEKSRNNSRDRNSYQDKSQLNSREKSSYPERSRYNSRDRNNSSFSERRCSRERNSYPARSRDNSQNQGSYRNRSQSNSRDKKFTNDKGPNQSYDRNRSNSYQNKPYVCLRCKSRDKDRSQDRNRDSSKDRRTSTAVERQGRSPYRDQGKRQFNRSTDRTDSRRRDNVRSRDNSTNTVNQRARSRESSVKARQLYPEMEKGRNCGFDYDPTKGKYCRKCSSTSVHHEFQCFRYKNFNKKLCTVCEKLNHFAADCGEISRFPPKTSEINSNNTVLKN